MKFPRNYDEGHNPIVIILMGPTASGKTELALKIAKELEINVINIDSRQLYIGMDIGTAKPTHEQQKTVPHQLIDIRQPDKPITVKDFQNKAKPLIEQALISKGVAFLVGGSGLYLKALTSGFVPPSVAPQAEIRNQLKKLGQSCCHQLLKTADPAAAARIAPTDEVRTNRALEVLYSTGQPISTQQNRNPPPWKFIELGLNPINLRTRIENRTEMMYKKGLIKETQKLVDRFSSDLPILQTIGYGEALQVIEGRISQRQAIQITTKRTQQLAKRQRTWFRTQHNPNWLNDEKPLIEALNLIQAGLG